ncbi:lytic murein transglycosylase [Streptomyces polyrhachis]|uniref:Lytic murein transglycosylase n=1 Tax=Streptomyces polyrhachis TaxID=1282885 RepID=A0ABW2GCC3_9ACTN
MAAQFGRRLRRGAATTAVAAAAMAALTASQAPETFLAVADGRPGDSKPEDIALEDLEDTATGGSPYYTDLPPLAVPDSPTTSPGAQGAYEAGIPATVLQAYKKAEAQLRRAKPRCNLKWQLLAAIGKVESGHARGGAVDVYGTTRSPILGPVLDGGDYANIKDTDGGRYDGDARYDRAVGPMQFIPGTWSSWGADANGDGKRDPNNIFDAALAAARYLCAHDRDLATVQGREQAILSYNPSREYLSTVLYWYDYYRTGAHSVPNGTGPLPGPRSDDPPADAGERRGGGGGGGGDPPAPAPTPPSSTPPGTVPPSPTPPPADPALSVARLLDNGTGALTAVQGRTFGERVSVKAATNAGSGVAAVKVRFTITGSTGARFSGGASEAVVTTGGDGTATAPDILAGETTGAFTVHAALATRATVGVDFAASVTARTADALTRVDGGGALSAAESTAFADGLRFKATDGDTAVADTAVTATIVASADPPDAVTAGPYFKAADGSAVRSRELRTDAAGQVSVPQLYADGTTGTFALQLKAAGGKTVYLTLTVTAAPTTEPTPTPDPTTDPTTDPSPAPTSDPTTAPTLAPIAEPTPAATDTATASPTP